MRRNRELQWFEGYWSYCQIYGGWMHLILDISWKIYYGNMTNYSGMPRYNITHNLIIIDDYKKYQTYKISAFDLLEERSADVYMSNMSPQLSVIIIALI